MTYVSAPARRVGRAEKNRLGAVINYMHNAEYAYLSVKTEIIRWWRVVALLQVCAAGFTVFVPRVAAASLAFVSSTDEQSNQQQDTGGLNEFKGFVVPDAWGRSSVKEAPVFGPLKPKTRTYNVAVTAYTSSVEECDNDPFVTADGSRTSDGIIAANFLPFNTKIRMPELFGNKVFEVHDRMNKRYWQRVDVWMENKQDMRQFGIRRNVTIEVLEWGDGRTQWKSLAEK